MSRSARIAKNTAYLYFRMLLIMGIQFFTVRVTLKYLGVVDYGIYNVYRHKLCRQHTVRTIYGKN